jgi:CBS domain-containing protein
MKVKDIMTKEPRTCALDTNLATAAALMLAADCGMLPVVEDGKLIGVVTDRDLFIALGTRNRCAAEMTIAEALQQPAVSCGPEDDVAVVLAAMKQHRIRRVPVVGFGDTVMGVVSMNDVLLAAGPRKDVKDTDVTDTFRAICGHHQPEPHVTAA